MFRDNHKSRNDATLETGKQFKIFNKWNNRREVLRLDNTYFLYERTLKRYIITVNYSVRNSISKT